VDVNEINPDEKPFLFPALLLERRSSLWR
jgi:hypothetical protein